MNIGLRGFTKTAAAACIAAGVLSAQDVIYMNNGSYVSADVLKGASSIDMDKLQSGELKYMPLGIVKSIKFSNGSIVNYKCDNCSNSNQTLLTGIFYYPKGEPIKPQGEEVRASADAVDDDAGEARPMAQIVADLDAVGAEMDSKDYADRKKKLLDFVAKSESMKEKLAKVKSAAPGCYELASFALEILKYTMDMSEQVGTDMKGYMTAKSSGSIGKITISPNKISFETSNALIAKGQSLIASAAKVKGELTGPTAVVGAPMLAFATACIPMSIKQLTLMTKAAKALKELNKAS